MPAAPFKEDDSDEDEYEDDNVSDSQNSQTSCSSFGRWNIL